MSDLLNQPFKFQSRAFLNGDASYGSGTVSAHLKYDPSDEEAHHRWVSGELVIGDCSRKITIDLDVTTSESLANTRLKILLMRDILNDTLIALDEIKPLSDALTEARKIEREKRNKNSCCGSEGVPCE